MLAKPPNLLAEALAYAARGWPVFPCDWRRGDKEKTPLVGRDKDADGKPIPGSGGLKKATVDPAQIREWWKKWPDALIGVRLGHESGVWVVDYDPRDGENVDEVAARMAELVGNFPVGPKSRTQSGGWHIWFRMPDGDVPKNSVGKGATKHIDWRAEGGYVILPPSRMSDGAAYEWLVSPDIAEFPDAPPDLLDLVFKRGKFAPKAERRAPVPGRVVEDDAKRRYCKIALGKAAGRITELPDGQRNSGINNIALGVGHLVATGGISRDEAYAALYDACVALGLPADDKALKPGGTLDRALDDGMREPADLSHVGLRARRIEDKPENAGFDPDTGEYPGEVAPTEPVYEDMGGGARNDEREPSYIDNLPFRCLGYNRGDYFYFSNAKQQITALRAKEHTPLNLLQLADLGQWQEFLGVSGKLSSENWTHIANSLIAQSHRAGIFVEKYVRGRGAWMDGKTVVVHTGDSARINGEPVALNAIPGRYIYEAESPWEFEFGSPASNKEAHALVDICSRLTWADPMSGALLAGWCVIAPVCGALKWRPHLWITGPSGSGKSTAVEEIVLRIVGPAGERFEGNTTEAGIRQTIGFDARPIIMDEAESEDAAQVVRMQQILALARIASSGGTVAKGSTSGRAMNFVARFCACFSSINTALKHHADESRVTRLILSKNTRPDALDHYRALMHEIADKFTPSYPGAMFSRTVKYLPALLANIEVFKLAASTVFANRRAADQIGPMLAGFYLCHSTGTITLAEAEAFIRKHDWAEHVALDSESDEMRLFRHLMGKRIRLSVGGSPRELSIGQVIDGARSDNDVEARFYVDALGPRGIRVDFDTLTISNTADGIRELLRDTAWSNDWRRPLSGIEGARKCDPVYFAPGLTTRGTVLPLKLLDE